MLEQAFLNVLGFVPWVTVLIALLLLLRGTRLAVSSRFYRTAWVILALRCALPVSLALPMPTLSPLPVLEIQLPAPAAEKVPGGNTLTAYLGAPAPGKPQPALPEPMDGVTVTPQEPTFSGGAFVYTATPVSEAAPFTLAQLVRGTSYLWAAGGVLFLSWRICCYLLFMLRLRRARRPITDSALCHLARDCFGHDIALYQTDLLTGPALAGLFAPAVYLTDDALRASELRMIFTHEACHARQGDIPVKWLLTFACAVCWFDPAVWLMARAADEDMERACDESVLAGRDLTFCKAYGGTILSTLKAGRRSAFSTEFGGGAKSVKARFAAMFDRRQKRRLTPLLALLLAAVVLGGSLISCTSAPAESGPLTPVTPTPQAEDPLQNVTYRVRDRIYMYVAVNESTGQSMEQMEASDHGERVSAPAPVVPKGFEGLAFGPWFFGCYCRETDDWFAAYLQNGADGALSAYLAHSPDNGKSWQGNTVDLTELTGGQSIYRVIGYEFLNPDTGFLTLWLSDNRFCILRTDDGGASWQLQYRDFMPAPADVTPPDTQPPLISNLRFVNETVGFASIRTDFIAEPIVLRTTDSGKNWAPLDFTAPLAGAGFDGYRACCILINGAAVEVRLFTDRSPTREQAVLTSTDLGESWSFSLRDAGEESPSAKDIWSSAVFFGDSLTTSWPVYSTGVTADQTVAALSVAPPAEGARWTDASTKESYDPFTRIAAQNPTYIFVQFGTNFLTSAPNDPPETLRKDYAATITALQKKLPNCKIYLQAVLFPTQAGAARPGLQAERVAAFNAGLAALATDRGCVFLDPNAVLAQDQQLKAGYAEKDGIHLTEKGYLAWKHYLLGAVTGTADPATDGAALLFPVDASGYRQISRGFTGQTEHNGVDLSGYVGTPILAAQAGVVSTAQDSDTGYGNYLILDHGAGLQTLYAHCEALAAQPGQTVEQGQIIGYLGSSGNATGPQCHFEVLINGEPVDPLPYFDTNPPLTDENGDLSFRF